MKLKPENIFVFALLGLLLAYAGSVVLDKVWDVQACHTVSQWLLGALIVVGGLPVLVALVIGTYDRIKEKRRDKDQNQG